MVCGRAARSSCPVQALLEPDQDELLGSAVHPHVVDRQPLGEKRIIDVRAQFREAADPELQAKLERLVERPLGGIVRGLPVGQHDFVVEGEIQPICSSSRGP